jgi:membrane-bound lytic murein transglycosylase B
MKGKLSIALLTVAVALLAAAAVRGEEPAPPSRAEYVSQVEPICQANTEANEAILRNVRRRVRNGKLKQAGRQFIHAAAAFGSAVDRIAAVPRPPADEERLLKWFKFLRIVQSDLRKVGKALKAGNRILAAHETIRVERSANAANNVSYVFEFNYCHLSQSRFT